MVILVTAWRPRLGCWRASQAGWDGVQRLLLLGAATGAAVAEPSSGKDNPNAGPQPPGCNPSDQQPSKCGEDGGNGGGNGDHGHPQGNCADGEDNDSDGFTDAADPECQQPGCVPSDNTPPSPPCGGHGGDSDSDGVCNDTDNCPTTSNPNQEDADDNGIGDACETQPPPPAADPCSTGGLLMDSTIGQTLWDGGLQIPPLTEDPDADGPLSGPLSTAADGMPLQPVFYEAGCAVDLLVDSSVGGDL